VSLTTVQLAEAFSRHEFESCYPQLAPDVRWTGVGQPENVGHDAVVKACTEAVAYLSTVTTAFTVFRVLSGDGFAVVESSAEYTEADGGRSVVSSCDVYRFAGELLHEITSYNIEVG
jgi:predicted anti-sigma-YlaC factor YlaD